MENREREKPKSSRLKIVIIILAVLLVLSAGGLAARYLYLKFLSPAQATVTVPDNQIGEEPEPSSEETPGASQGPESPSAPDNGGAGTADDPDGNENGSPEADKPSASVLELYAGRPDANRRFEVNNMLPGDTETRYFCVKASHDADIILYFRADVTEETKSLGDVLQIKVTRLDTGKVLCDAPIHEVTGKGFSELLTASAQGETAAYYQIDVSLDTSVGNEYQAAMLQADFHWYVEDEGGLTPPQTGDITNLTLWIVLAGSSLLLILLVPTMKRKKEGGPHGQA